MWSPSGEGPSQTHSQKVSQIKFINFESIASRQQFLKQVSKLLVDVNAPLRFFEITNCENPKSMKAAIDQLSMRAALFIVYDELC